MLKCSFWGSPFGLIETLLPASVLPPPNTLAFSGKRTILHFMVTLVRVAQGDPSLPPSAGTALCSASNSCLPFGVCPPA